MRWSNLEQSRKSTLICNCTEHCLDLAFATARTPVAKLMGQCSCPRVFKASGCVLYRLMWLMGLQSNGILMALCGKVEADVDVRTMQLRLKAMPSAPA